MDHSFMIEGLEKVLEGSDQPGVAELRDLLQKMLNGHEASGRFLEQATLQPRGMRVFRLRFSINGRPRSVVVKRLKPQIARRSELAAKRWLPAIRLGGGGPPLLGSVVEPSGACAWHVYDDLGEHELDPREPDRERVSAAVELVAQMHTRFAEHALLGEVRLHGGDLGIHFFDTNVRDAIAALEPLRGIPVRDRLLERLRKLHEELPDRATMQAGTDTLLHGDLWAINVFVL